MQFAWRGPRLPLPEAFQPPGGLDVPQSRPASGTGQALFQGVKSKLPDRKKEVLRMHSEIEHLSGPAKKAQIEKTERAARKLLRSNAGK
jgi:hypothetical protein